MSPFYRGERLIDSGQNISIGDRLPATEVQISDENIALVVPCNGTGVYVGRAMLVRNGREKYWTWLGKPRFVLKSEVLLNQESVSTTKRYPQVVWRKK